MKAFVALCVAAFVGLAQGLSDTDTITWGGDNSRAGYFENHNMDPAIVGSSQFDQVFKTALPGNYNGYTEQIFSQPLVYTPSGSDKQYVYWATTQNNVYKMDAKTGEILASRNLHIPFLTADLDGCVDINPTIGITATGVIDPATDTLYLTTKTYANQNGGTGPQGRPAGRYYIHALNVNDLSERPNFPIDLEGLAARNNPLRVFGGGIHHQRPGLLHVGQYVYAGFASHCVQYNFTGWIIGWDKTTGKIVEQWATEGDGVPNTISGGGIWMSGGGLASDNAGSMFFATGNGYASQLSTIPVKGYNPPTSMEEAACHMTMNDDGSLTLVDFFMPQEKQALDGADKDLGTSPLEILPSAFSCGDTKRIGVITGKSGKTYWLNLDNLGGYRNGPNQGDAVIQTYENENSVYAGAGVYPLEGGYIYINVIQYPSHVFKFSCNNGKPSFTKVADTPVSNSYVLGVSHGTVTSLNGQPGTGLLWITDVQDTNFRIYDAVPKGDKLSLVKSFTIPGITKFTRAVFGDGMVYIGTTQGLVYGYGGSSKSELNCTTPVDFGTVDITKTSSGKTISCQALAGTTVNKINLADGANFTLSGLPSLPLTVAAGKKFTFQAKFAPRSIGVLTGDLVLSTQGDGEDGSGSTHVRLVGTGKSTAALLAVNPKKVAFTGIITGQNPNGVSDSVIVANDGNSALTISSVQYSTESADGPFQTWSGTGNLNVGKFSLSNVPTKIAAGMSSTVSITFNTSTSGNFKGFVKFVSNGGSADLSITGSTGAAAVAVLEFQTPDGTDWVKYKSGTPLSFGDVTENTSKSRKFRVTNGASQGGVKLSITVSKPPFGVSGLIRAANQVDLAEGTSLEPGGSASATLTCAVPKSQWNVDPYNGTAQWTMNTNDPTFDKQFIQFFCQAVAEQAPPLQENGQGKYRYMGCFKENNPGRQLSDQLYADDKSTSAKCIQACADRKFAYCGTQYHSECWGGNKIPREKVEDNNCNFECSGDVNQICGGNGINQDGAFLSLFADSNAATDGSGGVGDPIFNPGVYGYKSLGCYTELAAGRALPNGKDNIQGNVAACVKACADSKYKYAGLEYGGECWCGSKIGSGSNAAKSDDCNMPCSGNSSECCGGANRLNVYQLASVISSKTSTTASTEQSITSTTNPISTLPATATLQALVSSDTKATESSTTATLLQGTTASLSTASTTTVSSLSTTSTKGISTTTNRVTSNTSPQSTSTPSAKINPTGPVVQDRIGSWDFQGCYTKGTSALALNKKTYVSDDMTLEACAMFCEGFKYFGTQYGRECYCGNVLSKGSVKAKDQKDCFFTCAGNQLEYYGANDRLQLYKKGTPSAQDAVKESGVSSPSPSSSFPSSSSSSSNKAVPVTSSKASSTTTLETASMTQSTLPSTYGSSSIKSTSTSVSKAPSTTLYPTSSSKAFCTASSPTSKAASSPGVAQTHPTAPTLKGTTSTTSSKPTSSTTTKTTSPSSLSTSATKRTTLATTATTATTLITTSKATSPTTGASSTSTISSPTASSSSASASATGPIVFPGNRNYTTYSCVSEPSNGRLLSNNTATDAKKMTIKSCLERCWMFKFVGVEAGKDCWCGNELNLKGDAGATAGKNVTSSQCSTTCPGDKKYLCGAEARINLYINNVTTTFK